MGMMTYTDTAPFVVEGVVLFEYDFQCTVIFDADDSISTYKDMVLLGQGDSGALDSDYKDPLVSKVLESLKVVLYSGVYDQRIYQEWYDYGKAEDLETVAEFRREWREDR